MNRCLVIDTSFIMADLLPDESGIDIDLALYDIHVPALFYLECMNVLNVALKRKRIKQEDYQEYLQILKQFPLSVDKFSAGSESLHLIGKLSQQFDLSTYDAAYLELALRLGAKLATLDKKLKAASIKNNIEDS
ncbi:MAG: type II toxin-antitoxin system VapC family toxin [Legionellales bacterium]|jgi:predicted nucleic acid-binding protein